MEPPPRAELLREIQVMMKALFELDPTRVHPDARLIEDLELDSIDAMDLAVKVEETTGLAFDETQIRALRTVGDVIAALETLLKTHDGPMIRAPLATQSDP